MADISVTLEERYWRELQSLVDNTAYDARKKGQMGLAVRMTTVGNILTEALEPDSDLCPNCGGFTGDGSTCEDCNGTE
jgi:hypothetical protein